MTQTETMCLVDYSPISSGENYLITNFIAVIDGPLFQLIHLDNSLASSNVVLNWRTVPASYTVFKLFVEQKTGNIRRLRFLNVISSVPRGKDVYRVFHSDFLK